MTFWTPTVTFKCWMTCSASRFVPGHNAVTVDRKGPSSWPGGVVVLITLA